jgi:hypothetical protein
MVSLCQMTTGRRPVCSRGRLAPSSAHQTSPRFNSAPWRQANLPTPLSPAQKENGLLDWEWSTAGPSPSGGDPGGALPLGSRARRSEGPDAQPAEARHLRIGLPPISRPQSYHAPLSGRGQMAIINKLEQGCHQTEPKAGTRAAEIILATVLLSANESELFTRPAPPRASPTHPIRSPPNGPIARCLPGC